MNIRRVLIEGVKWSGKSTLLNQFELSVPGLTVLQMRSLYTVDIQDRRIPSPSGIHDLHAVLNFARSFGPQPLLITRLHLSYESYGNSHFDFRAFDTQAAKAYFRLILLTAKPEQIRQRALQSTVPWGPGVEIKAEVERQERLLLSFESSCLPKLHLSTDSTTPASIAGKVLEFTSLGSDLKG